MSIPEEWHALPAAGVLARLGTHPTDGISEKEASRRLAMQGPNAIPKAPRASFLSRLWAQLNDFLILILAVAASVSALAGQPVDAAVILGIVVANAALGLYQESKAEHALSHLQDLTPPVVRVIRDGRLQEIRASQLVPGDLVLITSGDQVPADLRLVEAVSLRVNEAPLTGEAMAVEKNAATVLPPAAALADRVNMAYMGTTVVYGRGRGVVVSTGPGTVIGSIAARLAESPAEHTHMQQKLAELGRWLGLVTLFVCAVVFVAGVWQHRPLLQMFLTSVSLAVAAIPEGLPAVITVVLAIGTQRMAARHAVIRRLGAVEALGAVTLIASDKTGTLTENTMAASRLWLAGHTVDLPAAGHISDPPERKADPRVRWLVEAAVLCNDAEISSPVRNGVPDPASPAILGDPTEAGLLRLGMAQGVDIEEIRRTHPRCGEIPFSAERRRMVTVHEWGSARRVVVKGAPEIVLTLCDRIMTAEGPAPFTREWQTRVQDANDALALDAFRVLAVAYRDMPGGAAEPPEQWEKRLVFLGMIALWDPVRPEVPACVARAESAGVKTVMVTGDNPRTAAAVGRVLGLVPPEPASGMVISGQELEHLSDDELQEVARKAVIYARVTPEHKLRIVQALQANGHLVAVTGDGVNDVLALQRADVSVAMGITGTDVARAVSDMVLTDDNYASIVAAIEEGRLIYANIRKFVYFLLSCNVGEVLMVFLAMLLGLPVPLEPVHLLWVNLLTDSFPALALGLEKGEAGLMKVPPRKPQESIITPGMQRGIVLQSLALSVAALLALLWGLGSRGGLVYARTVTLATVIAAELMRAFTARTEQAPAWEPGFLSNVALVVSVAWAAVLLAAVVYVPVLQSMFHTAALATAAWKIALGLGLLPALVAEAEKAIQRRRLGQRA